MNLTKCFVAGLCLTAMTASAGFIKTNAFENGEDGTGWSFDGLKDWDTEGVRVANDASRDAYSGVRPLADASNAQVLKLDTEGNIWTNTVGSSFLTATNWVDMLVKFVPSEELPLIGTDVKLAIAVQQGTPNVLAISVIDQSDLTTNAWIVTSGEVDTNAWTRLTIELGNQGGFAFANVMTNGALVNTSGAYYVNESGKTLNSIGFQGTGFIDEVVVTDVDPFGSTATYFGTTGIEVNPAELTAWKNAFGVGTEVDAEYNAFLMNVAPDTGNVSPTLVVNSIAKGGTVTLTVKAKYANDSLVDLGTLNNGAVLKVVGKAALPDLDWTEIGSALDFDPTTYKFFKVTVAVPVAP